jgi:hypothetical protein
LSDNTNWLNALCWTYLLSDTFSLPLMPHKRLTRSEQNNWIGAFEPGLPRNISLLSSCLFARERRTQEAPANQFRNSCLPNGTNEI